MRYFIMLFFLLLFISSCSWLESGNNSSIIIHDKNTGKKLKRTISGRQYNAFSSYYKYLTDNSNLENLGIIDISVETYKRNSRLILYSLEPKNITLQTYNDYFILLLPYISPDNLKKIMLKSESLPCSFILVDAFENIEIYFLCKAGTKIYPEIYDEFLELIFTDS